MLVHKFDEWSFREQVDKRGKLFYALSMTIIIMNMLYGRNVVICEFFFRGMWKTLFGSGYNDNRKWGFLFNCDRLTFSFLQKKYPKQLFFLYCIPQKNNVEVSTTSPPFHTNRSSTSFTSDFFSLIFVFIVFILIVDYMLIWWSKKNKYCAHSRTLTKN